jgi:hypothetical protein
MSAIELLQSLVVRCNGGVFVAGIKYYVWRDGNAMIIEELKQRPVDEREALRPFTGDQCVIFTGGNGQYLTVGWLVSELLGAEYEPM